jgi:hypothetical protein
MTTSTLPPQLLRDLESLPDDQQRQVWQYVQSLRHENPEKSGKAVAALAGAISADDLRLMEQAIEEGCEQVDPHGW